MELSFDGHFALGSADADILVQRRGGDVLWQKERLLNIAIAHLPTECEAVAWLDCDVAFEAIDWETRVVNALEQLSLVHLYSHRVNLAQNVMPEEAPAEDGTPSAIYLLARGEARDADFSRAGTPARGRSTVGLGWASPREVLDRHGIYDACVLGGADRAIVAAALGRFELGIKALKMSQAQARHFLAWARPYHDTVRARVGNIEGRCFHLWHGKLNDRRYEQRLEPLRQLGFDPSSDIDIAENGLWQWSSDKFALHQHARSYFAGRNEDD